MSVSIAVGARQRTRPGWIVRAGRRALGFPLVGKLIGANIIIVAAAIVVHAMVPGGTDDAAMAIVLIALAAASVVNLILVRLALEPVRQLEKLAVQVSGGDFGARGVSSPLADAGLTRLGTTINGLLDSLAVERKRIRALGEEVIYAQDAERASVSRELHDSIAQTLAAVRFQIAAAGIDATGEMHNRLVAIGSLVSSTMEEVKNVSYSLHPRVAEDLGLEAALSALAMQVNERSGVNVEVNVAIAGPPLSASISTTLFRVAQAALRNVEMHAFAKSAKVDVYDRDGGIRIEVSDDGCGFDQMLVRVLAGRSRLGRMRDRVALVGGSVNVDSIPNGGTRVVAELKTLRSDL